MAHDPTFWVALRDWRWTRSVWWTLGENNRANLTRFTFHLFARSRRSSWMTWSVDRDVFVSNTEPTSAKFRQIYRDTLWWRLGTWCSNAEDCFLQAFSARWAFLRFARLDGTSWTGCRLSLCKSKLLRVPHHQEGTVFMNCICWCVFAISVDYSQIVIFFAKVFTHELVGDYKCNSELVPLSTVAHKED